MATPKKKQKHILIRRGYIAQHPLFLEESPNLSPNNFIQIGDEFITFCHQPNSHSLEQFCYKWLMSPDTFSRLCKKSDYLNECYKVGISILLCRRFEMVNDRKMPVQTFLATLHQYSPENAQWIMQLKKGFPEGSETIKILAEVVANSPLVKQKEST